MSFYNSLKQMWLRIEQKNIVFVSGNINEIIDTDCDEYKNDFPLVENRKQEENFINLIDHICLQSQALNYSTIKYFSPNEGIINFLNKKQENSDFKNDDEFNEIDQTISTLPDFIDEIKSEVEQMRNDTKERKLKIFVIDCSDILLDRQSDIAPITLASLVDLFTQFVQQDSNSYCKSKIKLVILARNVENINNLITRNNIEFASLTLLIPNKTERENFFNKYKSRFSCLTETTKEIDHQDYREAISYSDGLTFRELLQYAKIDKNSNDKLYEGLTFKELYKLVNFNKQESEWEKIDIQKMSNIDSMLSKKVKGQDKAIEIVKRTLIRSFTGMNGVLHSTSNNRKPKGCLFFVGPTGTGKTELAKSISEFVFGDETRIIRFDMSEFGQEHSDQRLIGAPPGYVGYDSGGELTNAIKQKPFTILLFDEIEKAHPRILDKFLQILEDGRLTSSQGEIIDFSETFIIFTSNIGTKDIDALDITEHKKIHNHFINAVSQFFKNEIGRPELLNRIGSKNIVPFNFITDENIINNIVVSKLNNLNEMLYKDKNLEISFLNDAKEKISQLVAAKYDKKMGGRGLIVELETHYIDNFSEFMFKNYELINTNIKNKKITKVNVSFSSNQINFDINE